MDLTGCRHEHALQLPVWVYVQLAKLLLHALVITACQHVVYLWPRSHLNIANAAFKVLHHQERMAKFDRACEEAQKQRLRQQKQTQQLLRWQQSIAGGSLGSRSAPAAEVPSRSTASDWDAPLLQPGTDSTAAGSGAAFQAADTTNMRNRVARNQNGVDGTGGVHNTTSSLPTQRAWSDHEDNTAEEDADVSDSGAEGARIPVDELLQRTKLEDASFDLCMDAMWAANVLDIQHTLGKVCRNVLYDRIAGRATCRLRALALRYVTAGSNTGFMPCHSPWLFWLLDVCNYFSVPFNTELVLHNTCYV